VWFYAEGPGEGHKTLWMLLLTLTLEFVKKFDKNPNISYKILSGRSENVQKIILKKIV